LGKPWRIGSKALFKIIFDYLIQLCGNVIGCVYILLKEEHVAEKPLIKVWNLISKKSDKNLNIFR